MFWVESILLLIAIAAPTAKPQQRNSLLSEHFDPMEGVDFPMYTPVPYEEDPFREIYEFRTLQDIMEDSKFLKEVASCRRENPKVEKNLFYKNLYCNITKGQFTKAAGSSCDLTEELAEKIRFRLRDFVIFDIPKTCEGVTQGFFKFVWQPMGILPSKYHGLSQEEFESSMQKFLYKLKEKVHVKT